MDERGRVDRPSREFRAEIFKRFLEGVSPLRRDGKLGGILMQFLSYVVRKPASLDYPRGRASSWATTRCWSSSGTRAGSRRT